MHVSEIASVVQATWLSRGSDVAISTLLYDSRRALGIPVELFFALPGTTHDGHAFIGKLYEKGVRNFIVSSPAAVPNLADSNVLKVADVLAAMQQLAAHHRRKFQVPVIGITGSNGKTIVKEWLAQLLERQWRVVKNPKSYNSQLGVPLSVWQMQPPHEVAVFEAGISRKGEMHALAQIIQPTVGIFTNLGAAHQEGFSSRAEKLAEKRLLFESCEQVICRVGQEDVVNSLRERYADRLITWSLGEALGDIRYTLVPHGCEVVYGEQKHHFRVRWSSPQDLENALHALTAALVLGENAEAIQEGLDSLRTVAMRLELKRGRHNTFILDDSYNNDLIGLRVALEYMLLQPQQSRKTVILSDILQSGLEPRVLYAEVNALLIGHGIARLVGVGPEICAQKDCFTIPFDGFLSVQELLYQAPHFSNELVLVKGARPFGLERIVAYLEEQNHGTQLEVNFEALTYNLNTFRSLLQPGVRLMVMVKAFAYGVGVEEVAHLLQYHQVDYLGVAYLDEAIALRRRGIGLPIMVMNVDWDHLSLLEPFGLEAEIYSLPMLRRLLQSTDTPPPIHLKIETGMNRLGFAPEALPELLGILQNHPQLNVAGIFTHFSSADDPNEDDYTRQQAALFQQCYEQLAADLGYRPIGHALNSAGIARWPMFQWDMVRLGIGLYGFDSSGTLPALKPIATLKTRISQIKTVKAGDSIGYGRKGRASQDGRIGTIAIGYADGYSRAFGNGQAWVLVNGRQARTVGNICMDMTMIDLTGIEAQEGDEVIVFGERPHITDLAKWAHTIPYEILTNVSQRVKRVFVSE